MGGIERYSVAEGDGPASVLAALLTEQLAQGKHVLWLVSGGSSLPVGVAVIQQLDRSLATNLSIGLVDDKYLPLNSPETNAAQFKTLGFRAGAARYQEILHGKSLAATAATFDRFLTEELARCDFAIGQFGLGEGYHTGGILPYSVAATQTALLATGYRQAGVGHVTVTPALITRLDIAFINSMGESKRPLVSHFLKSTASIQEEPTQALKQAKRTLLISDVLPD